MERNTTTAFLIVTLAIVLSVEVPLQLGVSSYASINSEDIATLFLLLYFTTQQEVENFRITVTAPRLTGLLIITSCWIVVTLAIAVVRSSEPVTASMLWTLKWLETIVFFLLVQDLMSRNAAIKMAKALLTLGSFLSVWAVVLVVQNTWRVRFFFNNPNTLAGFFSLTSMLGFSWYVYKQHETRGHANLGILAGILSLIGLLMTTSRSGMLGFTVAVSVLAILTYRHLPRRQIYGGVTVAAVSSSLLPFLATARMEEWLFGWFEVSSKGIRLSDSSAASSFKTRVHLVEKGIELIRSQPIFGYGWFASPSRVGYIDIYYMTLLVDVGVIGLVLLLLVHFGVVSAFLSARARGASILGTAGAAWYIGLLVQAIGGSFPRSPQILLLTFLLLGAALSVARSNDGQIKAPTIS